MIMKKIFLVIMMVFLLTTIVAASPTTGTCKQGYHDFFINEYGVNNFGQAAKAYDSADFQNAPQGESLQTFINKVLCQ